MVLDIARVNMIKQQLRTRQVIDDQLLNIINNVPRAHFVPKQFERLAYADELIPIGRSQTMMLPQDEAYMLQKLHIQANDKILEVGTGTGYVTALLSHLGKQVYSVDIFPEFISQAREKLNDLKINNVQLAVGDAADGWNIHAPYDVVAITGSTPYLASSFLSALRVGGRLFAIIGTPPIMTARLYTRLGDDKWSNINLFETNLAPLINAPKAHQFTF